MITKIGKYAMYFFIAFLTYAFTSDTQPTTDWLWAKLLGMSVLQGLIAMKALQSNPDKPLFTGVASLQTSTKASIPLWILIPLFLSFSSCSTTIYSHRTGRPLWRSYGDLSQVNVSITIPGEGTYILSAITMNHSRPAAVAWHGISNSLGAVALSVAPFSGGSSAVRLAAPMAAGAAQFKPLPPPTP